MPEAAVFIVTLPQQWIVSSSLLPQKLISSMNMTLYSKRFHHSNCKQKVEEVVHHVIALFFYS